MNKFLNIILIINVIVFANARPNWNEVEIESVKLFQEYLRINTSNPPGDVTKAISWLEKVLIKNKIPYETFIVKEDQRRMHILAEFKGSNQNLKPLLLLNHVDVVPAKYSSWSVDPFEAKIIDGMNI